MSVLETYEKHDPGQPVARVIGGACIMAVVLFAALGPLMVPGDPFAQSLMKALAGPEAAAPLGYDHLGRSVYHRLAQALRLSPLIALASVATAGTAGLLLWGRWRRRGAGGSTAS
ncbi:hypothetical protein [Paracoccus seriniphilus]|uniref:Peptide/nickel transport system permease protein n=1 Tax=Paracoccus seriniphilus TaxID=184748 RepID=A0A239PQW8_9RHOB|nr:hypothetical protein [Paracoccus seriniphilus]SNT72679.1 hypothetical protein SAMN05444959_103177 [Paracoccus seriniphilus]